MGSQQKDEKMKQKKKYLRHYRERRPCILIKDSIWERCKKEAMNDGITLEKYLGWSLTNHLFLWSAEEFDIRDCYEPE